MCCCVGVWVWGCVGVRVCACERVRACARVCTRVRASARARASARLRICASAPPRVQVQVMAKNTKQPLFRISVSTLDGVEMKFLVKRGYQVSNLAPRLWKKMLKLNIVSKNTDACLDLACDGVKMSWSKKLKDYNIRDDVDVSPALVVVLRRFGT